MAVKACETGVLERVEGTKEKNEICDGRRKRLLLLMVVKGSGFGGAGGGCGEGRLYKLMLHDL